MVGKCPVETMLSVRLWDSERRRRCFMDASRAPVWQRAILVRLSVYLCRCAATKVYLTRSFATAKNTVRPSCLVGVFYDISGDKNSAK